MTTRKHNFIVASIYPLDLRVEEKAVLDSSLFYSGLMEMLLNSQNTHETNFWNFNLIVRAFLELLGLYNHILLIQLEYECSM